MTILSSRQPPPVISSKRVCAVYPLQVYRFEFGCKIFQTIPVDILSLVVARLAKQNALSNSVATSRADLAYSGKLEKCGLTRERGTSKMPTMRESRERAAFQLTKRRRERLTLDVYSRPNQLALYSTSLTLLVAPSTTGLLLQTAAVLSVPASVPLSDVDETDSFSHDKPPKPALNLIRLRYHLPLSMCTNSAFAQLRTGFARYSNSAHGVLPVPRAAASSLAELSTCPGEHLPTDRSCYV